MLPLISPNPKCSGKAGEQGSEGIQLEFSALLNWNFALLDWSDDLV